ncbi:hypothetical protein AVEN_180448-1 [Araneus ventricosus]|uniref:Uncharacterized protein n=1 Tax=Araneus ventricosus TaxID=182803 RepID=A0A4Y2GKV8_ARAVE|nr:hypothetical protein AVEN_180448-1 [Araneus ventricosus]
MGIRIIFSFATACIVSFDKAWKIYRRRSFSSMGSINGQRRFMGRQHFIILNHCPYFEYGKKGIINEEENMDIPMTSSIKQKSEQ